MDINDLKKEIETALVNCNSNDIKKACERLHLFFVLQKKHKLSVEANELLKKIKDYELRESQLSSDYQGIINNIKKLKESVKLEQISKSKNGLFTENSPDLNFIKGLFNFINVVIDNAVKREKALSFLIAFLYIPVTIWIAFKIFPKFDLWTIITYIFGVLCVGFLFVQGFKIMLRPDNKVAKRIAGLISYIIFAVIALIIISKLIFTGLIPQYKVIHQNDTKIKSNVDTTIIIIDTLVQKSHYLYWQQTKTIGVDSLGNKFEMEVLIIKRGILIKNGSNNERDTIVQIAAQEDRWKFGSIDSLEIGLVTEKLPKYLLSIQKELNKAKRIICVGTASVEGDDLKENKRADKRADQMVKCMRPFSNGKPIDKLILGRYAIKSDDNETSSQRRVIIITVLKQAENGNIKQAVINSLRKIKDQIQFNIENYSNYPNLDYYNVDGNGYIINKSND